MNLTMKQKQTHRHREQSCGCQGRKGVREGWMESLEVANSNGYRIDKLQGPTI